MKYIGIDIGTNGALACLDESSLFYMLLKEDWIDYIRKQKGSLVMIEDLHSIYGSSAKSNFQFGVNNGLVMGALTALRIDYLKVHPKLWQKEMWRGVPPILKNGKVDTKATSLEAARLLYPTETFLATKRSTTPHDGIVDAVLLAHYCKLYDSSLRHRKPV